MNGTSRIPVGPTIDETYRFAFGNLGTVVRLTWLPIILLTIGDYFALAPYYSGMAAALDSGNPGMVEHEQLMLVLRLTIFAAASLVVVAMIAVTVTREILGSERPASFFDFSLGPTEFRVLGGYFGLIGVGIGCVLVMVVVGGTFYGILSLGGGAGQAMAAVLIAVIELAGLGVMIFFLVRLGFLLVPAVLTEGGFGLKSSWGLTEGNFWRIFGVVLATGLPIGFAGWLISFAILNSGVDGSQAEQMRQMAERWPFAVGVDFLLWPLRCGLAYAPAAIVYGALKGKRGERLQV